MSFITLVGFAIFAKPTRANNSEELKFNFLIQSWTRHCRNSDPQKSLTCEIPQKLYKPISINVPILFPENEGEVEVKHLDFDSPEGIKGVLRLFATFPHSSLNQSKYIQIQFETIQPSRSFCIQTVRLKTPMEFSPTSCTSFSENTLVSTDLKQFGYNLIQVH